jgi:hypothetical protein
MTHDSPLFIIGMPRSGTSLLRELINNSPEISIPPAETLFIPQLWHKYRDVAGQVDTTNLYRFYTDLRQSTFWFNLERFCNITLPLDVFIERSLKDPSLPSIINETISYYAQSLKPGVRRWGEKSPEYRKHIPLLSHIFQGAQIVHIIRDPRDAALSANKAWGKNMLRYAYQWNAGVFNACEDGSALPEGHYYELHYEDLLADPETAMAGVFQFAHLAYSTDFLEINTPFEKLGKASGKSHIVADNQGEYATAIPGKLQQAILSITRPARDRCGISVEPEVPHQPIPSWKLALLKIADGIHSVRFHMQEKGILTGIRYFWRIHQARI